MDNKEIKIDSTKIYDGKIVKLRKDKVLTPNGNYSYREVIDHQGGVGILFVKDNQVLLIEQYRYPYEETVIEIPAGKIEKGEDIRNTAIRELEEETGYYTEELKYLGAIYPSCGYTNEIIHLFLATNATMKETHFDEDELITCKFYLIEEVKQMIKERKIKDAKTIAAIYHYLVD